MVLFLINSQQYFRLAAIGFISGFAAIQLFLAHPLNYSWRVLDSLHAVGVPAYVADLNLMLTNPRCLHTCRNYTVSVKHNKLYYYNIRVFLGNMFRLLPSHLQALQELDPR